VGNLSTLNERQKEAVLHTEGPLLIIAGAGAGKTKTLTHRIAHLVEKGIKPENILAITFTNKAAHEMRERAINLLLENREWREDGVPFISTFHSLGVHIIKNHASIFGLTRHFAIADEGDALSLIKDALKNLGFDPKEINPNKIRSIISRFKGDGVNKDEYTKIAQVRFEKIVAQVWVEYEKLLKQEKALDFDDLLLKTVELLRNHPEILKIYQDRFKYIHVDEYQDTNALQYNMVNLLVGKNKNICVVGDSDQNIYSWRGANIKNILNFEEDFPGAKVVLLERNYRSTKNILEAANAIISKNTVRKAKNLFTESKDGEKIDLVECFDENIEGRFIAGKIGDLVNEGKKYGDFAVLYRANFQSRAIEEAMLSAQIPYKVLGTKFFDRKEVKDVLSYIRASLNKESLSDIKRIINVPARGIGKVTIAKIFAGFTAELPATMQIKINNFYKLLDKIKEFSETSSPSEIVKFVIEESGLRKALKDGTSDDLERLENIEELVTVATSYDVLPLGEGIEKLLENSALASEQDSLLEKSDDAVRLMTVHASKGLEFDNVFITGLEQDLFPHKRNDSQSIEDQEEERRLFYVALTRAAKKIFLCFASIRTLFGNRLISTPSEFIYDIPEDLLERTVAHREFMGGKIIYLD